MSIANLTPSQLRQAADLQEKIEALNHQLAHLLSVKSAPAATAAAAKPTRKKISAAGIAKIKAAQKARWAKIKGNGKAQTTPVKTTPAKTVRRKMSAEARARIAAAAKARWAKVRAEKADKK